MAKYVVVWKCNVCFYVSVYKLLSPLNPYVTGPVGAGRPPSINDVELSRKNKGKKKCYFLSEQDLLPANYIGLLPSWEPYITLHRSRTHTHFRESYMPPLTLYPWISFEWDHWTRNWGFYLIPYISFAFCVSTSFLLPWMEHHVLSPRTSTWLTLQQFVFDCAALVTAI